MDIASILLLSGLGLVLALLVAILVRKPAPAEAGSSVQVDELKQERDALRSEAERQSAALSEARQTIARTETVLEERDRLRIKAETLEAEKGLLASQFASLKAQHEAAARHHDDKLAELDKARERLTETFKLTADEIIKTRGAELNKQGAAGLEVLLKPLRDQLVDFRTKVETDAKERSNHAGEIKALMDIVRKDATQMSQDAKNLTNALTSSSKVQGDWGELLLSSILEQAGLRKGQEFFVQQSETLADGTRLRPDVVVELPGKQKLVIDSKVSLKAFNRFSAEDATEEVRGAALKAHLVSFRAHVKELSGKDYGDLYQGVDFTIMFVPLEGATTLALNNDPTLPLDAAARNVMIATPTTLMMAMRTVQNLWAIDKQNRYALEIADRAGKLYDKFHGFVTDLDSIGVNIGRADTAWRAAKNKLTDGPGNIVGQTEKLKSLGAKARKSLPEEYLDAVDVEDVEDVAFDEAPRALAAPQTAD